MKKIAFGWYGGKFSHLNWLLPLLPECRHYVEPFAGSGAVLLNRQPSPCGTYNDLDGEVVNFFRVLRDDRDQLIERISLTPFSQSEYEETCDIDTSLPEVERARMFYVRARQVFSGLAQAATPGRWAKGTSLARDSMHQNISKWLGGVEGLPRVAERLLTVQIDNRPAIEAIQTYDSEDTLFYVDPPYVHSTRGDSNVYAHEMTDKDHEELAGVLHSAMGKVAISNYECDLMNHLYGDWSKHVAPIKANKVSHTPRAEVLWTNYKVSCITNIHWPWELDDDDDI